jgi:hypothetical protein
VTGWGEDHDDFAALMAMNRPGAQLAGGFLVASVGRLRNWRMRGSDDRAEVKNLSTKPEALLPQLESICGPAGLSKPSTCRDRAGCVPVVLLYTIRRAPLKFLLYHLKCKRQSSCQKAYQIWDRMSAS